MEKQKLTLIVEDDIVNSELLEVFFKRKNLKYIMTYTGEQALEIFEEHPEIDLVLLDIRLPKMDGEDVLVKMKAMRPHIPIIVQSAYVFDVDRIRFFEKGCDDYISKPIIKKLFYEKLSQWLKIDIE